MRGKIKPLYCLKIVYLRLEGLKILDAFISTILHSCPNIRFFIFDKSKGFSNIPIIEIARYCPKHLELGDCSISNKAVDKITDYSDDKFSDSDLPPLIPDLLRVTRSVIFTDRRNEIVFTNTLNITDLISAIRVLSKLTDLERINLLNSLVRAIGQ
ncbi:hypothetical protein Glove_131g59 [Diversispora epigaea]|uniref:Uncharacterized protein n=1 Tax=Diversispora epigaea TaxID=1348612 RepID=A0A397J1U3_9GLOM|nr:hypothetical protein Glove_131g59 [Diversispora epigaea]